MFELRLDSDFSLIGKFETKNEAIEVMNAKIDDVLIEDSILMFDGVKLVFSRNGKKNQVKKNNLNVIYIALIAKKAENIILKNGFKTVLSLANTLSKGVKKSKKSLIFKACYLALKKLDMSITGNKKIVFSVIRKKSIFDESKMITFFHIVNGSEFIPLLKRYKVMPYDKNEIIDLMKKYNFNVSFVRG